MQLRLNRKDGKKHLSSVITSKGKGYKTSNPSIKNWLPEKEK